MKKLIKVLTFWIPIKKWRRKAQENLKKSLVNFIPLKKNWIIFYDTFSQNGNGDNIRPLAEELRRRHPDFKFFFVAKEKKEIEMADEVLIVGSKRFEDISEVAAKKIICVEKYASQKCWIKYPDRIEGLNKYREMLYSNVAYAEAFRIVSSQKYIKGKYHD